MNSKGVYIDAKNDYKLLKSTSIKKHTDMRLARQDGGYIIIHDDLADKILNMFNVKLFIEIIKENFDQSHKLIYDEIAYLSLRTDKYKKLGQINKDNLFVLRDLPSKYLNDINKQNEKLFNDIYNHCKKKSLSSDAKMQVVRDLAVIFKDKFWKRIFLEDEVSDFRSIFDYYSIIPSFKKTDNFVIVDAKNYILDSHGEANMETKFFEFDRMSFSLTKVYDVKRIEEFIRRTKKDPLLDNRKIITTNFYMHDMHTLYDDALTNIKYLFRLSLVSEKDKEITGDIHHLLPGCIGFLGKIFNFNRGEYTNKNNLIYAFLFTNTIGILFDLMTIFLADENAKDIPDHEMHVGMRMDDVPDGSLMIDKIIFGQLHACHELPSLLRAYNYYCLLKVDGKIDMDNGVKFDVYRNMRNFVSDLKDILMSAVKFKNEIILFIHDETFRKDPSDLIKIYVIMYILYVIREKSNLHINVKQVIDTLTMGQQLREPENTEYDKVIFTNWIYRRSETKIEFTLLPEFVLVFDKHKFNSCGETMTLNLMNYILLKDNEFVVPEDAHPDLLKFYAKYPDMKIMRGKMEEVTNDWAELISNKNPNVKYVEPKYNCELIPTGENVFALYRYFFPSIKIENKDIAGICDIIKIIDPAVKTRTDETILHVDDLHVFFSLKHGEMVKKNDYKDEEYNFGENNIFEKFKVLFIFDIYDKLLFFERFDIIRTKMFMDVINSRATAYIYRIISNCSPHVMHEVLFNEFSDPINLLRGLMTFDSSHIEPKFRNTIEIVRLIANACGKSHIIDTCERCSKSDAINASKSRTIDLYLKNIKQFMLMILDIPVSVTQYNRSLIDDIVAIINSEFIDEVVAEDLMQLKYFTFIEDSRQHSIVQNSVGMIEPIIETLINKINLSRFIDLLNNNVWSDDFVNGHKLPIISYLGSISHEKFIRYLSESKYFEKPIRSYMATYRLDDLKKYLDDPGSDVREIYSGDDLRKLLLWSENTNITIFKHYLIKTKYIENNQRI